MKCEARSNDETVRVPIRYVFRTNCTCSTRGHATAAPPSNVKNSRRLTPSPSLVPNTQSPIKAQCYQCWYAAECAKLHRGQEWRPPEGEVFRRAGALGGSLYRIYTGRWSRRALLAALLMSAPGRGRDASCPAPPAQVPACVFLAPGSYRRSDAIGIRGLAAQSSSDA